jgi:2-polyprenyl-3-methyl-5-hydroxy-6-metoxy-1,4-benzoquinol methylase
MSALSDNHVNCPYCHARSTRYFSAPDFNRRVSDVVFDVSKCLSCQLRFVTNRPADLERYYTTDYHFIPKSAEELEPHLAGQQFKIDIVNRFKRGGALLEIGPGTGMFCRLAQRSGFDVSAIEMDAECVKYLQSELGVRAVASSDAARVLSAEHREYDAICLWHSIEHMTEPWEVLEQAIRRLAPDGILVVAAPNPDAWQARVLGARWPHHDLPRHLFGIPIAWLLSFGSSRSLTPELVTTCDEGSLFWNRFTWAMLARSMAKSERDSNRFWRWGMRFGQFLQAWEGREGRGATYTIVLRRTMGC